MTQGTSSDYFFPLPSPDITKLWALLAVTGRLPAFGRAKWLQACESDGVSPAPGRPMGAGLCHPQQRQRDQLLEIRKPGTSYLVSWKRREK